MQPRTWPTLKSCNQKSQATVVHHNDRLSLLPDDILLNVLSHLTMKEAARASLVSRMWKHIWLFHPLLNFEDINACLRLRGKDEELNLQEISCFVDRVNYVVKHHRGPVIDEFKIDFDLNHDNYHPHLDNWLVFAFAKQVKRLELSILPFWCHPKSKHYHLKMPVAYQVSSNSCTFKSTLTSLCLVYVHLTAQVIESFLDSFPSLEILCIRSVRSLTSIRACSSLPLKHLEVSACESLKTIDLVVPHLLSFTCEAQPTALHFRNASSLSVVSMGSFCNNHLIACPFDCLLVYGAQLECLELKSNLDRKANLQINQCPVFTNLRHLALNLVIPIHEDVSVLGWTAVIRACPALQKLSLYLDTPSHPRFPHQSRHIRKIRKLDAHPLSSLKTLEVVGFLGPCISLELVMYVIENADRLEEMIVDARFPYFRQNTNDPSTLRKQDMQSNIGRSRDMESHRLALELVERIPVSAKLIFR